MKEKMKNLPKGWEIKKLKEIGEVISGGTPSTTVSEYWNGNISWISPSDLTGYNEIKIRRGKKSITELGLKKSSAKLMPKGSVLFSCRAPIGYVAIADEELCTNQGFKSIIPNANIDSLFIYYFLKNSKQEAEKVASGTTFKEISLRNFSDLQIPLPPLETQQRIVSKIEELFSELEKGVEELKKSLEQLKVYRQSVLKWAFEGRFTSRSETGTSRDLSVQGELPEGWECILFGNAVNNYDGKRKPLSRKVRLNRQGKFRYYGATEIVDYIDDYIFDGKYLLIGEDGANLLSKNRPLAFIVEGKFWVNNHAHVIQSKDFLNIEYLNYYINSININQYVSGTAQPKLNQANMNKIPISFPSIEEQHLIVQEIERRLSVADKMEEQIKASLQQAEALKQSILKKAFEGELVTGRA